MGVIEFVGALAALLVAGAGGVAFLRKVTKDQCDGIEKNLEKAIEAQGKASKDQRDSLEKVIKTQGETSEKLINAHVAVDRQAIVELGKRMDAQGKIIETQGAAVTRRIDDLRATVEAQGAAIQAQGAATNKRIDDLRDDLGRLVLRGDGTPKGSSS